MENEYLTIEEAAEFLGRSVGYLRNLRYFGRGPSSWIHHGRVTYPRDELERYRTRQRGERS